MDAIIKVLSTFLAFLQFIFCGISYGDFGEIVKTEKDETEIINNIDSHTNMADTIKFAHEIKNQAQARYTTPERTAYEFKNSNMILTHSLTKNNSATLTDLEGNVYIADSFDTYFTTNNGKTYYSSSSSEMGRVNIIRLGVYYYDCHVRDFDGKSKDFKVDKTYHLYGDRLYNQSTLFACEETTDLKEFGSIIKIPADSVASFQAKDANGTYPDTTGETPTLEYVAFDIKNVGVVGFIAPCDGSVKSTSLTLEDGYYVLKFVANYTAGTGINKHDETGSYSLNNVTFGTRIYTDKTHSFDGIEKEAYLERNPLAGITVDASDAGARFIGYDSLRGAYTFTMNGTDFTTAYNNPERQYKAPITITSDEKDRTFYIRMFGTNGCLEAGAILDDANTLVPIDVEVCKNFQGDGGEPFYSVKDYQYGDSFFPVSIKADETLSFTLVNIFQNWGNFPLKQLSSIEFHVSYYHLSTGATETNCIAPYFVGNKDGWLLPDFRTRSGIIWPEQPQFNSVGVLNFVNYTPKALGIINKETVLSEYVDADIKSVGQTYSDIYSNYISDCGSYEYTLRHVEFPQTDENRTYYEVEINFLRGVNFADFRRDFDLFYFDGRSVKYDKTGYLDANNTPVITDVDTSLLTKYYTLGSESPYFSFFDVTDDTLDEVENRFGCSFALIVRDSEIIVGGEKTDIPLAYREQSTSNASSGVLTLDAQNVSFKAGDSIKLTLVLLPWGQGTEQTDAQVLAVREDSALKPATVTASKGTVKEDKFIPIVVAENNEAEFTIKGGRNNIAVRVDGFTNIECPEIYMNGEKIDLASSNGYDGYSVYYNDDGTYGFSFVYEAKDPDTEYSFTVKQ
ncbi:MAG: hypothetical protein E7536_07780 [Ruminococcaceae bacterium]|nr:hypothetical protein [Oscillospiraceae bacterium]